MQSPLTAPEGTPDNARRLIGASGRQPGGLSYATAYADDTEKDPAALPGVLVSPR